MTKKPAPRVALNMIVRNEAATIERCLASVCEHIACWVIVDTGSTDGTPEIIRRFFADKRIPGELHHAAFENFAQARNEALHAARVSRLKWDYLLLCDADMELRGALPALSAPVYHLLQVNGGLAYYNVRLVNRHSHRGKYIGATHEYYDFGSTETRLDGAWFMDHGDGGSHADKSTRDVRLLCDAILKDPDDARSWFYLANTYREIGQHADAIKCYDMRIEIGGWEQEVFCAKLYRARCLLAQKNERDFVQGMLDAFAFRPSRAEPLYDLAKHYRMSGSNHLAVMYAQQAITIPLSSDALFVEADAYDLGPLEEISIAGYYVDKVRDEAMLATDQLVLEPRTSAVSRANARTNMFYYLQPLSHYAPSFKGQRIDFTPPDAKYTCTNPSITAHNGDLYMIMRTVNYRIRVDGSYDMQGDTAIRTVNHFMTLGPALNVVTRTEIKRLEKEKPPLYHDVLGFEDCRLFFWHDEPCFSACMRETNAEGWCDQVFASLTPEGNVSWFSVMQVPVRAHEKNWMPFVDGKALRFVHRVNTVIDYHGDVIASHVSDQNFSGISGGSQLIPFDGGFLAVVHEAWLKPNSTKRFYQHRWAWFDGEFKLTRLTRPFFFNDKGIEFAAGLCKNPHNPQELLVSYGFDDREAWVGRVNASEVRDFLWTV